MFNHHHERITVQPIGTVVLTSSKNQGPGSQTILQQS